MMKHASLMAQWVKKSPAVQETQEMWVWSLGREDSLEEMATHSSILAWKIPRTEKPGGLQSMGLQRARQGRKEHDHDTTEWYNMRKKKHVTHSWEKKQSNRSKPQDVLTRSVWGPRGWEEKSHCHHFLLFVC